MEVIELDFDFESFLNYYVVHEKHYFVFEEVSEEPNCSIYVQRGNYLVLYTRVDERPYDLGKLNYFNHCTQISDPFFSIYE